MKKKISIIVPCYNVEDFLDESVESLINQTYKDIEIILVDDGSKDSTPQLCDKWASKDSRIKVVHKSNGGLVSARNAGYEAATGEWLMYLDSDDWIDTDTCEKLIKYLEKYPNIDICFWKCIQELGEQSITGKWEWPSKEKEVLYTGEQCKDLARHTLIYKSGIATAYCKLIRTSYAKKYDIKHDDSLRQGAEGMEFSLRSFYYANEALYVNEYFNHYRYNADSISKQINEKNTEYITDCFKCVEKDISSFENQKAFLDAAHQRAVYALIAVAMSTYFHPNNKDSIITKVKKYKKVIKDYKFYQEAIKATSYKGLDKARKVVLFLLKIHLYMFIAPIAYAKIALLKKGKFNY